MKSPYGARLVFIMIVAIFVTVVMNSCAKDSYTKKEDPKARSNNYYMRTDQEVELEDYGFRQDPFDASHGCSLIR